MATSGASAMPERPRHSVEAGLVHHNVPITPVFDIILSRSSRRFDCPPSSHQDFFA